MKRAIFWVLVSAVLSLAFTACTKEGPMEKAGEKIDNGIERAGDAVEEATER